MEKRPITKKINSAEESFRQAWKEALEGETFPIETLCEELELQQQINPVLN